MTASHGEVHGRDGALAQVVLAKAHAVLSRLVQLLGGRGGLETEAEGREVALGGHQGRGGRLVVEDQGEVGEGRAELEAAEVAVHSS